MRYKANTLEQKKEIIESYCPTFIEVNVIHDEESKQNMVYVNCNIHGMMEPIKWSSLFERIKYHTTGFSKNIDIPLDRRQAAFCIDCAKLPLTSKDNKPLSRKDLIDNLSDEQLKIEIAKTVNSHHIISLTSKAVTNLHSTDKALYLAAKDRVKDYTITIIDELKVKLESGVDLVENTGEKYHFSPGIQSKTSSNIKSLFALGQQSLFDTILLDGLHRYHYSCNVCTNKSSLSHAQLMAISDKNIKAGNFAKSVSAAPFCKVCRENVNVTLLNPYIQHSFKALCDLVVSLKVNYKINSFKELNTINNKLYKEIKTRKKANGRSIMNQISRLTGLVFRPTINWNNIDDEVIIRYAGRFNSRSGFSKSGLAQYLKRSHSIILQDKCYLEISRKMKKLSWSGAIADSYSELILFNLLHTICSDFIAHPRLEFYYQNDKSKSARATRGDAFIPSHNLYIEVSAVDEEHNFRAPNFGTGFEPDLYLENLRSKETHYRDDLKANVLRIEASIYKFQGYSAYIEHIREKLALYGIELPEDATETHKYGRSISVCLNNPNDIADFIIDKLKGNGITALYKFHQPTYNKLKENQSLWDQLQLTLQKKIKLAAPRLSREVLPTATDIQLYVKKYDLSRVEYVKIQRDRIGLSESDFLIKHGELGLDMPDNAPQSPYQVYGLTFNSMRKN